MTIDDFLNFFQTEEREIKPVGTCEIFVDGRWVEIFRPEQLKLGV